MRIAYITQSYPPGISGASVFARQLAEGMAQRGHAVLVIAPSESGGQHWIQDGNLSVARLRSHHNPFRANQRYMLFPRREMLQSLRLFKPDVLHSHDTLLIGLVGLGYSRRARIPIVTTTHQLPAFVTSAFSLPPWIRDNLELALWMYARWLLGRHTAVITQTRTTADRITLMTGLPTRTISCGADLLTYRPPQPADDETATRLRLGLPPGVPILLHVGQLHHGKRVERVITAAARSMKETDAHLLVVGDGPQKADLMNLCRSLGIAERSHFPGFITVDQGLPEIYRLARLFVTASEIETQGIVLLEAAASGLPIAAVRATCIPEIVHDGENGFLAEPGDLDALARAMIVLTRDQRLARRMGKASRALAPLHDQRTTMSLHEELYRDMLAMRLNIPVKENEPVFARLARWLS